LTLGLPAFESATTYLIHQGYPPSSLIIVPSSEHPALQMLRKTLAYVNLASLRIALQKK